MTEEGAEDEKAKKAMERRMRALKIEQQKREVAKRYLDPAAYERIMNVRISSPELYARLIDYIISMAQGGRLPGRITDAQLKDLLSKLTFKPETTIEFRHK